MVNKEINRRIFLKMLGFVALSVFILPGLKKFKLPKFSSRHKEARFYKNLAG